jgi:predicted nucleic acid-binding protein
MKYILDANTLIYLTKADMLGFLHKHFGRDITTDTHVYKESITDAPEKQEDAIILKRFLEKNQVPIVPVEIENAIELFRDEGEASCYSLASKDDIIITNDKKAIKRLKRLGMKSVFIEDLIFSVYSSSYLEVDEVFSMLERLKSIHAITPTQLLFYYRKLYGGKEE